MTVGVAPQQSTPETKAESEPTTQSPAQKGDPAQTNGARHLASVRQGLLGFSNQQDLRDSGQQEAQPSTGIFSSALDEGPDGNAESTQDPVRKGAQGTPQAQTSATTDVPVGPPAPEQSPAPPHEQQKAPTKVDKRKLAVDGLPEGLAPTREITNSDTIRAMDAFGSIGGKIEYFRQGEIEQIRLSRGQDQRVVTIRSTQDFDRQLLRALQDFAVQTTQGGLPGTQAAVDTRNLATLSEAQLTEYIKSTSVENSSLQFRAKVLQQISEALEVNGNSQLDLLRNQLEQAREHGDIRVISRLEATIASTEDNLNDRMDVQFDRLVASVNRDLDRFISTVKDHNRPFSDQILPGSNFLADLERTNALSERALQNLSRQREMQARRILDPNSGRGELTDLLLMQDRLESRVRNTEDGIDILDQVFITVGGPTVDFPNERRQRSAREAIDKDYRAVVDQVLKNGFPSTATESEDKALKNGVPSSATEPEDKALKNDAPPSAIGLYGKNFLMQVRNDRNYQQAKKALPSGLTDLPQAELLARAQVLQEQNTLYARQVAELQTELAQSPYFSDSEKRDVDTIMSKFDGAVAEYQLRINRAFTQRGLIEDQIQSEICQFENVGAALALIQEEKMFIRNADREWNTYLRNRERTVTGRARQEARRRVERGIRDIFDKIK